MLFSLADSASGGLMRRAVLSLAFVLVLVLSGFPSAPVLAFAFPPLGDDDTPVHVVAVGETLFSIASRYGVNATTLAQFNDLADPREIYVGQPLSLPAQEGSGGEAWQLHTMALAETFSLLAQRSGLDWQRLARANRILNPATATLGHSVLLPPLESAYSVRVAPVGETWWTLALRHGLPYWEVVRQNQAPIAAGGEWVQPGAVAAAALPYPIAALTLAPQPVVRGEATVLELETVEMVSCTITYLDQTEVCYRQDPTHLFAFVSLSPLLEPGEYEVKLAVRYEGMDIVLDLPLVVAAGRFGYERIDVSGSLSQLMDPALMETERNALDAVADLRTQERQWDAPLEFPVQAAVSSYFGSRRSYGGSYNTYHSGVDFRAGTGTPVLAPADGHVVLAQKLAVRGNAIMVDHGWGLVTGYWHLSQIDVAVGDWVSQGQVIGRVGNTGLSTGSHLHWEMWVDAQPVNPLQWVEPFFPFPPAIPAQAVASPE